MSTESEMDFEQAHAILMRLAAGLPSNIHGFRELMLKIAAEPEAEALSTVLLVVGAATTIEAAAHPGALGEGGGSDVNAAAG